MFLPHFRTPVRLHPRKELRDPARRSRILPGVKDLTKVLEVKEEAVEEKFKEIQLPHLPVKDSYCLMVGIIS